MLLNVYVSRDQLVTMPPSGLIESAITRRRQKALEMTGFIDRFHLMPLTSRKPAESEPRRGNVGISQRCIRCARKRFTDYLTTKNAEIAKPASPFPQKETKGTKFENRLRLLLLMFLFSVFFAFFAVKFPS
ncbi:MAG: hypothetical protein ABSF10_13170 [Verrucomicrobiota bacterium]|jgi:hypothetical protein